MSKIKRLFARISAAMLAAVLMCSLSACRKEDAPPAGSAGQSKTEGTTIDMTKPVKISIEIEKFGTMYGELYPDIAPITVKNFVDLAFSGFYDGLLIHRVSKGFVLQGGDPEGTGTGGPGYTIKGEFKANGAENRISHVRGILSMARNNLSYDSAGSQFFIVLQDSDFLDGNYAGFGKITDGMDVADAVEKVKTREDRPLEDVVIKSVKIIGQ